MKTARCSASRPLAGLRVWSFASTDPEETNAVQTDNGVRVRHHQLTTGRYSAAIEAIRLPALQFAFTSYGAGIVSHGAPAGGAYGLALPLNRLDGIFFDHHHVGAREIGIARPGQEFHLLRPAGFQCVTVFPDSALLDRLADAMFGRRLSSMCRGQSVLPTTEGALHACARHLAQLCHQAVADPSHLADWSGAIGGPERLASELIDDVLGTFCPPDAIIGWSNRHRIVRQAWEIIEDDSAELITVSELCVRLGTPIRTLDAAFDSCVGMSPKRFIIAMRLNKVRRMLSRPNDDTTVTGAATRFGFFHFGHFAESYAHLFGELPSDTLRRARH